MSIFFGSRSFQLLCHRDPSIQKVAFDCIMTYKHKYLNPYRCVQERNIQGMFDVCSLLQLFSDVGWNL